MPKPSTVSDDYSSHLRRATSADVIHTLAPDGVVSQLLSDRCCYVIMQNVGANDAYYNLTGAPSTSNAMRLKSGDTFILDVGYGETIYFVGDGATDVRMLEVKG